jgi:hypothetical protein
VTSLVIAFFRLGGSSNYRRPPVASLRRLAPPAVLPRPIAVQRGASIRFDALLELEIGDAFVLRRSAFSLYLLQLSCNKSLFNYNGGILLIATVQAVVGQRTVAILGYKIQSRRVHHATDQSRISNRLVSASGAIWASLVGWCVLWCEQTELVFTASQNNRSFHTQCLFTVFETRF